MLLCAFPPPSGAQTTYLWKDPESGAALTCDRCAPGTYLRSHCTATQRSVCDACPPGSFTELWNYIEACLPCSACGVNQEVSARCTAHRDTACRCVAGHYYVSEYEMCLPHSTCPCGSGVVSEGSLTSDTSCQPCPWGSFSERVSALDRCTAHSSCAARGQQLVLAGAAWHDSVCANCTDARERDAAGCLRGILPGFFIHQNIPVIQLQRLLSSLPQPDPSPRWEVMGRKELHLHLNAWVLRADVGDLLQLKKTLRRAGSAKAARKLQKKLDHIQKKLNALCVEDKKEE
ncbi:unnamed protein product [Merluccius merluccius]